MDGIDRPQLIQFSQILNILVFVQYHFWETITGAVIKRNFIDRPKHSESIPFLISPSNFFFKQLFSRFWICWTRNLLKKLRNWKKEKPSNPGNRKIGSRESIDWTLTTRSMSWYLLFTNFTACLKLNLAEVCAFAPEIKFYQTIQFFCIFAFVRTWWELTALSVSETNGIEKTISSQFVRWWTPVSNNFHVSVEIF